MKGIVFKPEMIKAIVEGRKTVIRRVIKPQPPQDCLMAVYTHDRCPNLDEWVFAGEDGDPIDAKCPQPRYQVGETVYIKEAWATELRYNNLRPSEIPHSAKIFYANDGVGEWPINLAIGMMRSTLHLPEVFARYFIEMKDVRAERLQEITEEDAILEGMPRVTFPRHGAIIAYGKLWNSLNKDYPWESNPWVFKYEFERNT